MLTIIDGADTSVEQIVVMLYAQPNYGKTSLSLTASKPVLLDFDGGAHRAANRAGKAVVRVHDWTEVAAIEPADLEDYDTVIIDTVGTCLDWLAAHIMRNDSKCRTGGGAMSLQGYGALKAQFSAWLSQLKLAGKDVVLIAHLREEVRNDVSYERIVASGGSKEEVYREADLIGRILIQEGRRILTFDPTEAAYGKNCGIKNRAITTADLQDGTLAAIVTEAKDKMNAASKASMDEAEKLAKMKETFINFQGVDDFNETVKDFKEQKASPVLKKILMDVATECGYVWDKGKGEFVEPTADDDVGF